MIIKAARRIANVDEYYFSTKLKQIAKMRSEGKDVINLGIGSPDNPPSENTIDKLVEYSRKDYSHGYQGYVGIPELRKAFSLWYKKYFNVNLNPENQIYR